MKPTELTFTIGTRVWAAKGIMVKASTRKRLEETQACYRLRIAANTGKCREGVIESYKSCLEEEVHAVPVIGFLGLEVRATLADVAHRLRAL